MTTLPPPTFIPLAPQAKYPHMQPRDIALWTRFLKAYAHPNLLVAYDVHVGSIPQPTDSDPPWLTKYLAANYPLKIDAVIRAHNRSLVCEIKPYAGPSAIGQALCYAHLYHLQYPTHPRSTPMILTDRPQLDTPRLCTHFGILLVDLPQ